MNRCNDCEIEVIRGSNMCPLCFKKIGETHQNEAYPKYKIKVKDHTIFNIFLFLSIVTTIISIIINIMTFKYIAYPWSLFVFLIIIYLWILIKGTILSKMNGGAKIVIQAFSISIALIIINMNTSSHIRWSLNYAVPFIISGCALLILILVRIKKMLWNQYISYLIALLFFCFIPIILYIFKIVTILWPSVISATFALISFISLMIFQNNKFKDEFESRFHI